MGEKEGRFWSRVNKYWNESIYKYEFDLNLKKLCLFYLIIIQICKLFKIIQNIKY